MIIRIVSFRMLPAYSTLSFKRYSNVNRFESKIYFAFQVYRSYSIFIVCCQNSCYDSNDDLANDRYTDTYVYSYYAFVKWKHVTPALTVSNTLCVSAPILFDDNLFFIPNYKNTITTLDRCYSAVPVNT